MNLAKYLIFVRHGESIGNILTQDERAELAVPNHAYPLTDRGIEQAKLAGKFIKRGDYKDLLPTYVRNNTFYPHWINMWFESSLVRSQQTMDIILDQLDREERSGFDPAEVYRVIDNRLDEKWDGIFHDLSSKQIEERYPEQIRLRERTGYYRYRAPGGESCPDAEVRIISFINEYFGEPSNRGIGCGLIVGHGRWFQIFQKVLHELTIEEFDELKTRSPNHNCAITIYAPGHIGTGLESIPESVVPWKDELEESETTFA